MNDELRELVLNENVPMSLVEEFSSKVKALKDKAEKLNSAMRETRSFSVKLDCVEQMTQLLEKRTEAEEDFVKEARKYVKKGGMSDGRE
jgi:hypothetical protein|uniref:Uncharacterized protein n=1 Tax=Siphoviridae sp. ctNDP2 TaxID=2826265 RepID=A0A8S5NFF1_9CAUD|nr:MAG TPA: hypothetical protein [Siphoviridae sp. ctNDP2]